jgi:hypothetical protein
VARPAAAALMLIEWADGESVRAEHVDFVIPTVEEALKLIAEGATNRVDLLEQAGLSTAEAEAELGRLAG